MGHNVQLIVGRGEAVAGFLRRWPGIRAVDLRGGWQAVPVNEALYDAISARHPAADRGKAFDSSPPGLEAELAASTLAGGALAYVETAYFGGAGEQAAVAFADGREAMTAERGKGPGPINSALRRIGVQRTKERDEFDAIGLGERRMMDDYERTPLEPAQQDRTLEPGRAGRGGAPLWIVVLVIVAAIAGGVFMAMS